MSAPPWFVTGTDTGVGKTWASLALIQALQDRGVRVAGMKPVASGCAATPRGLRNADAQALRRQAGLEVPYAWVNPYAFAPPIAPHLAAAEAGTVIELPPMLDAYRRLAARAEQVIVEGVGGWRVPLGRNLGLKDLALALDAEVVLVVGLRLGCINHALLSAEAIERDGCRLRGWIANPVDAGFAAAGPIAAVRERLDAPLLGVLPYLPGPEARRLSTCLSLT